MGVESNSMLVRVDNFLRNKEIYMVTDVTLIIICSLRVIYLPDEMMENAFQRSKDTNNG